MPPRKIKTRRKKEAAKRDYNQFPSTLQQNNFGNGDLAKGFRNCNDAITETQAQVYQRQLTLKYLFYLPDESSRGQRAAAEQAISIMQSLSEYVNTVIIMHANIAAVERNTGETLFFRRFPNIVIVYTYMRIYIIFRANGKQRKTRVICDSQRSIRLATIISTQFN